MRHLLALVTTLVMFTAADAAAALKSETIEYKDGTEVMEGYLVFDSEIQGRQPGVLVVHEWWGLNDYIRMRANMLARQGYVVFAADLYGKGVRPANVEEAREVSSRHKSNRKKLGERTKMALDTLKKQPNVDPNRVAAVGYCFGGLAVLDLARAGADVKGVVSVHGTLAADVPAQEGQVKARVLVLHGGADPFVPSGEVSNFEDEMKNAKVSYEFVSYPGAVHGFTNPENKGQISGALYDKEADTQSWEKLTSFLKQIFS